MIIVDASVFNKLFLNEPDRSQAQAMFTHAIQYDVPLIAPHILLYEALAAALHVQISFETVHKMLTIQRRAGMRLVDLPAEVLEIAQTITTNGNKKSGYPSLQDSLYHALAIHTDGQFVTADRKHFAKTKEFGHITLLSDWKP